VCADFYDALSAVRVTASKDNDRSTEKAIVALCVTLLLNVPGEITEGEDYISQMWPTPVRDASPRDPEGKIISRLSVEISKTENYADIL
jgi:hypothetical protein